MFAVVRTGGKQYRVSPDDRIRVEKLPAAAGAAVTLSDVLMVNGGDASVVGAPLVDGAAVHAEVVEHTRNDKVLIFKKKRRKNHRRLKGHRQPVTVLRITGIDGAGGVPLAVVAAEDAPPAPADAPALEENAAESVEPAAEAAPTATAADETPAAVETAAPAADDDPAKTKE